MAIFRDRFQLQGMTFLLFYAAISDPVPDAASVGPTIDHNASNGLAFRLGSCQAYINPLIFCGPSPPPALCATRV
jgi:hypothetical protein